MPTLLWFAWFIWSSIFFSVFVIVTVIPPQNLPHAPALTLPSADAAFGADLPDDGFTGTVTVLEGADATACAPLSVAASNSNAIALVVRGGTTVDGGACPFDTKVVSVGWVWSLQSAVYNREIAGVFRSASGLWRDNCVRQH
jgi:hypothetical protein